MKTITFKTPAKASDPADRWVARRSGAGRDKAAASAPASSGALFALALPFSLQAQLWTQIEGLGRCGAVLARGLETMSQEWLELAEERLEKGAGDLQNLLHCRTPQDFAAEGSRLARSLPEDMLDRSRRVAETWIRTAREAAESLAGPLPQPEPLRRAG